jgi:hypothetical protein
MTQAICDRCKEVLDFSKISSRPVSLSVSNRTSVLFSDGDSEKQIADLCQSCFKELTKWLEDNTSAR